MICSQLFSSVQSSQQKAAIPSETVTSKDERPPQRRQQPARLSLFDDDDDADDGNDEDLFNVAATKATKPTTSHHTVKVRCTTSNTSNITVFCSAYFSVVQVKRFI